MKKRKAPIKMYQMGTPNLVPQGIQKTVMDNTQNIGNNMMKNMSNDFNTAKNIGQGLMSGDFNQVKNAGQDFLNTQKNALGNMGNMAKNAFTGGGLGNILFPGAKAMGKAVGGFMKGKKLFDKGTSSIKGNIKPKKYIAGVGEAASAILSNPQAQQLIGQIAPQLLGKLGSFANTGDKTKLEGAVDTAIGTIGSVAGGGPLFTAAYNVSKLGGKLAEGAGRKIGSWIDKYQDKKDKSQGKYNDMYGRPYAKKNGSKLIKYNN